MQSEITLSGLQPYLSYLGTFVQLGGTLLLFALLMLLRRYARRRRYFLTWSNAWGVLVLALFFIVLRYNVMPAMTRSAVVESAFSTKFIYFVYQTAKISFYGLVIAGTQRYVRAAPSFGAIVGAAVFTLLYSALSVWQARNLNLIVVWQSPVAVLSLSYAASLMLRLPPLRRSLGSAVIGNCLAFGALLWAVYFTAFSFTPNGNVNPLRSIVIYNPYLDLLWQLSLGFGMVVLLMEDLKHEANAAHAELAVAHDNLRRASFYDSVTGSLNRQAFADGLGLEAAMARFGTVIMLDMDNLKYVNDQHGHAAGDVALRYLVEVLRASLRASDKLYRWGGDEFMLVFPGADTPQVCRRIRRILENAEPVTLPDDSQLKLSVSVGGATYASGEQLVDAIDLADRAMYADKVVRKSAAEGVVQSA